MERKDFIKKFVVGGSILLTAPVLLESCSIALSRFIYEGHIIVTRRPGSTYIALPKNMYPPELYCWI